MGSTKAQNLIDAKIILENLGDQTKPVSFEEISSHKNNAVKSVLMKYDKDEDGQISPEEAQPLLENIGFLQDVKQVLKTYDKNSDGILDEGELEVLVQDYASKQESAKFLERWDKNKDGSLDIEELKVLNDDIETTDTAIRYTGYARTIPLILRYAAYTSDVGESFRPIILPKLVTLTYGISWAYVIGDVAYEGFKARYNYHQDGTQVARLMTERVIFQSFASMIFPAFIIHSAVKIFQKGFGKWGRFQRWGPTLGGLGVIPALPFILDRPVEHTVHYLMQKFWPDKTHTSPPASHE